MKTAIEIARMASTEEDRIRRTCAVIHGRISAILDNSALYSRREVLDELHKIRQDILAVMPWLEKS